MKISEIVTEAEGDFEKYRQLGRNPFKLAGHLAKEIPASAVSAADKTIKLGKTLAGIPYEQPDKKPKTDKSVSSTVTKTSNTSTLNVEKTKLILDKLIKGESASREEIQHLIKLRNQVDDAQLQMTLDKIQRGSALEFTDLRNIKIYRNSL